MNPTVRDCCDTRLALFVGGPADGTLQSVATDELGLALSHVYIPDADGVTHHLYGARLGVGAEYRHLGALVVPADGHTAA